jgi:peptide/nickel transport system substrate-binding protein
MKRLLIAALTALALPAAAQDRSALRIGVEAGPTSLDPHYASLITNIAFARHVFQPLVEQDARQVLRPAIARSWRVVDDTTWELELDPNACFADGRPVTVEDVAFTIARAGDVPNSPSSFRYATRPVAAVDAVGPHTIRLRTNGPFPLLLNQLALVMVVPKRDGLTTAAFNDGSAMVGSGPYRLVSWQPGQPVRYARNDAFAGAAPAFATVEFRPIANAGARVAALQAGDLDLAEIVPPDQFARFKTDARFATAESPSNRLIFLTLDSSREESPHVRVPEGSPARNPLRDARVRRALSIAINREALVSRNLQGQAVAAGDLGPAGYFGTSPDLTPPTFDLDGARRLLAEAGFPRGFTVQVNGPNDRYVNDEQVVQAIAQMWTRAGLEARVEVMPASVFFTRAGRREFSAFLIGFGSTAGDAYPALSQVLHSFDQQRGLGGLNRGRYSNPAFDALLARSNAATDAAERDALLREATRLGFATDHAIIPLHFPENIWAMRSGFEYRATVEESTLAQNLRPR